MYVVLRVVMSQCELPFLLLSVLGRTCTDSSIFLFSVKSPEPPTTCREVNSMNLMMQSRHAMLRWVLWGTPGYSRVLRGAPVGALGLAIVGGAAQGTQCPRVSL